jgi:citrate lyase subunit beta/citryl-CoA lyase
MRSGLMTPGSSARMLEKAASSVADFVHIELEDGIPPSQKEEARDATRAALTGLDWNGKLTLPRVNGVTSGFLEEDVDSLVPARPGGLLLAKCNGPEEIHYLDGLISAAERRHGVVSGTIRIAAMIERIRALSTIDAVAVASPRMVALYLGPSDLANEVGYRRTYSGLEFELTYIRSKLVVAAHTAGLLAIDSPYVPFRDLEGTYEQARWCYRLGFDGKSCVSPKQLDAVNRAFTPDEDELRWAEDVLKGETAAKEEERGVWVAQGMMMDAPHVIRAKSILREAAGARENAKSALADEATAGTP